MFLISKDLQVYLFIMIYRRFIITAKRPCLTFSRWNPPWDDVACFINVSRQRIMANHDGTVMRQPTTNQIRSDYT